MLKRQVFKCPVCQSKLDTISENREDDKGYYRLTFVKPCSKCVSDIHDDYRKSILGKPW